MEDSAPFKDRKDDSVSCNFRDIFPTESAGDGAIRDNNLNDGGGQGKPSSKRKISCGVCGYIFDSTKQDLSGGSEDGDGAGGEITLTSETYTDKTDVVHTHYVGLQSFRKGAGCPLCFSKNSK